MLEPKQKSVAVRLWNHGSHYGQIARRIGATVADVESYLMSMRGWPNKVGSFDGTRIRPRREPSLPRYSILEQRVD
jgi:hypothetical protein